MEKRTRHKLIILVFAGVASCTGSKSEPLQPLLSDMEKVRRRMAENQVLLVKLQNKTDENGIKAEFAKIIMNLEECLNLKPFTTETERRTNANFTRDLSETIEMFKTLAARDWKTKEQIRENFSRATAYCGACHQFYDEFWDTPPRKIISSQDSCGKCHSKEYNEWSDSMHAKAYTDPVFLLSAGNPPTLDCRTCHSAQPILSQTLEFGYSYRPRYRHENVEEGINCMTCHALPDGGVAARKTNPFAPCRPIKDDRLGSVAMCGACHNPTHETVYEWQARPSKEANETCMTCHASYSVDGKFDHRFKNSSDIEFIRRYVVCDAVVSGSEIILKVTNNSGHKFPAEVPTRVFKIICTGFDSVGDKVWEQEFQFRRPLKTEIGWSDNRPAAGETKTVRAAPPGDVVRVVVEFLLVPSPLVMREGWILIGKYNLVVK